MISNVALLIIITVCLQIVCSSSLVLVHKHNHDLNAIDGAAEANGPPQPQLTNNNGQHNNNATIDVLDLGSPTTNTAAAAAVANSVQLNKQTSVSVENAIVPSSITKLHRKAQLPTRALAMTNTETSSNQTAAPSLFYPEYIRALSSAIGFSNLSQLNITYNHLDKYGYLNHVRRYLSKSENLHSSHMKREKRSDEEDQKPTITAFNTTTIPAIEALFEWSLRFYQKFMALPSTGKLDQSTIEHMKKPRCGNRDLGMEYPHQRDGYVSARNLRSKRYVLAGSRWKKSIGVLDWCITQYPKRALATNQTGTIHYEIWKAFKTWARYLPIPVRAVNCLNQNGRPIHRAKVDIRFAVREHGDGDPFDGPGGMLAHAYYPIFGGDLHFDEEERWTNNAQGSNLFIVALHEIGHILGLDHSEKATAIMTPVYQKYKPNIQLTRDDIIGLYAIYEQPS